MALPTATLLTATFSILLASVVWYLRVQRLTRLRETVNAVTALSEEVLSSSSIAEIQSRLEPRIVSQLAVARARIYLWNEEANTLDPAIPNGSGGPVQIDSGDDGLRRAFTTGTSIAEDSPRACLWLPMITAGRTFGVLELESASDTRRFHPDEREALQHLANQIAMAVRLLDQRQLREQALRGERLGAVGQLIAGIAGELRVPLERITRESRQLVDSPNPAVFRVTLQSIEEQASLASSTLDRLVSFSRVDQASVRPIDLNQIIEALVEFRGQHWRTQLIEARLTLSDQPLVIVGSSGQIEQALLSLFIQAEQSLAGIEPRRLGISSANRGEEALIEIHSNAPIASSESADGPWALSVARGIVENHGGSIRTVQSRNGAQFLIHLPLTSSDAVAVENPRPSRRLSRSLNLLLVEPDLASSRHALAVLGNRNQRVVPVTSAGEAIEILNRFRFDAILASVSVGDMEWSQFLESSKPHVAAIVALQESFDANVQQRTPGAQFALRKPVEDAEIDEVLVQVEDLLSISRAK
jgi:K+-sensing histidine kinase KdpD